jgi:drug/metabolite transporter (DMT)-like permease
MGRRLLPPLYLTLATSIWGSLFVVSKGVLGQVSPLDLVWLRYLVALVALGAAGLVARNPFGLRWRHVGPIAAIGLSGYVLSILAQFTGTAWANAQWGAVLTSSTPAFMMVFARPLLGEPVTIRKIVAAVLAVGGAVVMVGLGHPRPTFLAGGAALIGAAVAWALMSVLVKRLPNDLPLWTATFYAMLLAWLVLTPWALPTMLARPWTLWTTPHVGGSVLYIGLVSTALAFYLWNRGLAMTEAGTGGLYFVWQPVVGTLLAAWLLHEPIGAPFVAGALMVLAGIWLVSPRGTSGASNERAA